MPIKYLVTKYINLQFYLLMLAFVTSVLNFSMGLSMLTNYLVIVFVTVRFNLREDLEKNIAWILGPSENFVREEF